MKFRLLLAWGLLYGGCQCLPAADAPLSPVSVCEVLQDLDHFTGKVIALLGRYSVRPEGRWISQDHCQQPPETDGYLWPTVIWLHQDSKEGPPLASPIEFDEVSLYRKLSQMHQGTSLVTFRFGSPDYDRWSVVVGRLEVPLHLTKGGGFGKAGAPAQLLFRGDGAVFFFADK